MCGIVGYTGERPAVDVLLRGLKRLEYRGYDSSGIAFLAAGGIEIRKSQGKLENIEKLFVSAGDPSAQSHCGIGHTRWATHGKPTTQNAHPHRTGHVVLVHNGIIENYQEIRTELLKRGHRPQSETDSELFGFLVLEKMDTGASLTEAVRQSFLQLQGSCSVVVMSDREPGTIVGVRNGAPLVAAVDPQGGAMLASDAQPLLEYARDVIFMENGDLALCKPGPGGLTFLDIHTGQSVTRAATTLDWSPEKMDKQGYPHYMLKEIHEQAATFVDTLNALLDRAHASPFPLAPQPGVEILEGARELILIACGTSWHAALLGKYWIERWAKLPVQVEMASEFRYRNPVVMPGTVIVGISQSGETADTLAVLRDMKARGIKTLGLTNVRGSSISRDASATFFTSAGPEIGVAATKTFTAQLLALLLWAGHLARVRGGAEALPEIEGLFQQLVRLPHNLEEFLQEDGPSVLSIRQVAKDLNSAKGFFFIGRGYSYPIALEGALKLKEIAYVHAEGYAAGELKHGPIAMIDQDMVVVVLSPQDAWRDKTVSNLEEVKARGARIVGIGGERDHALKNLCQHFISLPEQEMDRLQLSSGSLAKSLDPTLLPFLLTPVIQLLSYEIACLRGTDVDKPRNLAKSVTVE